MQFGYISINVVIVCAYCFKILPTPPPKNIVPVLVRFCDGLDFLHEETVENEPSFICNLALDLLIICVLHCDVTSDEIIYIQSFKTRCYDVQGFPCRMA